MDAFGHITLLLSFVFALALTHLLSSATDLVRERARVKFSWTHALWMTNAVILLFGNWMALLGDRRMRWDIASTAIQFLYTVLQYFTCSMVSPHVQEHGEIDLWQYHQRHKHVYLGAFLGLGFFSLGLNIYYWWMLGGHDAAGFFASQLNIAPMLFLCVVALVSKPAWLQFSCALVLFAMICTFTLMQSVG